MTFTPEWVAVPPNSCSTCGHSPLDLEPNCPTCNAQQASPNVAVASRQYEQEALARRLSTAFAGKSLESADSLCAFGDAVRQSVAVVNVSARYAIEFLATDRLLYASYGMLVRGSARRPATGPDDLRRRSVDALLFGSYADEIRYAALSLDGVGLFSYGPVAMVLRNPAIEHRASLLEENSFAFVERHKLRPGSAIPLGYRSPWQTRHQLAMAKYSAAVDMETPKSLYTTLLMKNGDDRSSDEFIEVYVFGPFDRGAIERVVVPAVPRKDLARTELRILMSKAKAAGVPVDQR